MKKTLYKSKLGLVQVVSDDEKLVRLDFNPKDMTFEDKSKFNDFVITQLEEYAEGKRKKFDIPIKFPESKNFYVKVWKKLQTVGYGKTVSYKELAQLAGSPDAARAVGTAMRTNPVPVVIPCHRVIKNDGTIGEFSLGLEMKKKLLQIEQIDGLN